jgi:hypothetical protein
VLPLLLDEGLPPSVSAALSLAGWKAYAVGGPDAPPQGSEDEVNCRWCAERSAVLVTNDRGRKDRTILDLLAQHRVHALFVHNDLRGAPAHLLLRAVLNGEEAMDDFASRRHGLIRHRLKVTGRLEAR